jgi:hypothetical protein
VVDTQERVDVVHRLRADVRELLDLRGRVLDLLVGEDEPELLDARLDRVPAGEAVSDRDVAREPEVLRLQDLVRARVVQDRLGVDAGLVRERAVATGDEQAVSEESCDETAGTYVMGFENGTFTSTASAITGTRPARRAG